ncbi:TPA: hypothetical protein HA265_07705 [Candidatus Woesearchaeota archaeon]|nr:hypothetical protein [Candidatus Woesearchaeota archaeon]
MEKAKTTMIEIVGAITLVLVLSLVMLGGPSITGFQAVDFVIEDIDLDIAKSQVYTFSAAGSDELLLTSIRLSGEVLGDGKAEVYLDNGRGQRLLIFSNVNPLGSGMDAITGMATGPGSDGEQKAEPKVGNHLLIQPVDLVPDLVILPVGEGEELSKGVFGNECRDTCYIRMSMSSATKYKLLFMVQEGTLLKVDKLLYTLDI